MLKRGKMSDRPQARQKREKKDRGKGSRGPKKPAFDPNKPQMLTEEDKARIAARQEERQKQRDARPPREDRPRNRDRDRDRDDAPRGKPKRGERTPSNEGRVYTFESAKKDGDDDNNPFAILKNLKK